MAASTSSSPRSTCAVQSLLSNSSTRKFLNPHKKPRNTVIPRRIPQSQSTQHNPSPGEEEECETRKGIKMEISPSVLRALDGKSEPESKEHDMGLIERNRLKRAAKFNAKKQSGSHSPPFAKPTSPIYQDCNDLVESLKQGFPRLQKPGMLDVDKILSFAQNYMDFQFILPQQGFAHNQKLIDDSLVQGCLASVFLAAWLRSMGGLSFIQEKDWYSEKVVVYIMYNHLVGKMKDELVNGSQKKAEEIAAVLGKLEPLVKTVVSPELLALYAFQNSGFAPDGRIGSIDDGYVFPGTLNGEATEACNQIQEYLDLTRQDNVVFLLRSENIKQETFCLIAPWSSLMVSILPDSVYAVICSLSLILGSAGMLQFHHADPGFEPFLWEALIAPFVFLSIIISGWVARWFTACHYKVNELLRWPLVFPSLGLGATGGITSYRGCLPNRDCLLNLSLASVLSSLALSSVACLVAYFMDRDQVFSSNSVHFYGYFLVPSNMFSFSQGFTLLLKRLSVATFTDETGNLEFVVSSFALSGLAGLSYSCFSLLPVRRFDGARILAAVLGRENQKTISRGLQILVTPCFLFKIPLLGFTWLFYTAFLERYDDMFQKEEVSEPPLLGKIIGMALVVMAPTLFVPAFL